MPNLPFYAAVSDEPTPVVAPSDEDVMGADAFFALYETQTALAKSELIEGGGSALATGADDLLLLLALDSASAGDEAYADGLPARGESDQEEDESDDAEEPLAAAVSVAV